MLKKFALMILILSICTLNVICEAGIVDSGNCGDNVRWELSSDGTLTISGSGKMTDYLIEDKNSEHYGWFYDTPWQNFNQNIVKIVVNEGVTSIGSHSFVDCKNLRSVSLSSSIRFIGSQAFKDCVNLEAINIPPSLTQMGSDVFSGCAKLANLKVNTTDLGTTATVSNNIDGNEYSRWAQTVKSHLYVDGENLVRVECIGGQIIVEKYSPEFKLISAKRLESDMSNIWGGFFAGKNENYIIVGRPNPNQSDSAEVIRILQYDKNWNLKNQTTLAHLNTVVPFDAASLRCAEYNGMLYIHTGHKMYRSSDGQNHQSNMTISIRESDMKCTDASYNVSNNNTGYVSHSFNQFILVDSNGNIVTFDHGDAFPRAAILMKYRQKAGSEKFNGQVDSIEIVKFNGHQGDNATGASIGGLAETKNYYVTVYNYDGVGGNPNDYNGVINKRNLFINFTNKSNFSTAVTKISSSDDKYGCGTPFVVPTNLNGGYILWNEMMFSNGKFNSTGKIAYLRYSDNAETTQSKVEYGQLSDCQPIIYNGKVTWYVTDNSKPIFYTLDESGITTYKL